MHVLKLASLGSLLKFHVEQISEHVLEGAIKVHVHHGAGRVNVNFGRSIVHL